MPPPNTRTARREASAQKILQAARDEFGAKGFKGTTMRSIAARAGIDSSLVHQHYGSKNDLFSAAIGLAADEPGHAASHLGEVLALKLGDLPPETTVLMRSMLTSPEAASQVSGFLNARLLELTKSISGPDAQERAILAVSSTFGLTILRQFLDLPSIKEADPEDILRVAREWFETLTQIPHSAP
jgi:AcrR family transcriptional regulator